MKQVDTKPTLKEEGEGCTGSLCLCGTRGLVGTVFARSKGKPPFAAELEQGQFPSPGVSLEIHIQRRTVVLHQVQAVEDESVWPDRYEKLQQGY